MSSKKQDTRTLVKFWENMNGPSSQISSENAADNAQSPALRKGKHLKQSGHHEGLHMESSYHLMDDARSSLTSPLKMTLSTASPKLTRKTRRESNASSLQIPFPTKAPTTSQAVQDLEKTARELEQSSVISKKEGRRLKVISEVLQTEIQYVGHLENVISLFIKPLLAQRIISDDEKTVIFANTEAIRSVHAEMMHQFESVCSEWVRSVVDSGIIHLSPEERATKADLLLALSIGSVFIQITPYMKMYSDYMCGHKDATNKLDELIESRPKLRKYLQLLEAQDPNGSLLLKDYLIMPVQRIPRYRLLLDEIDSLTPECHPDKMEIQHAKHIISELCMSMNERLREHESQQTMVELQEHFSKELDILAPYRRLELHSDATIGGKAGHCYLFNDLVLMTRTDHKKHALVCHYTLLGLRCDTRGPELLLDNGDQRHSVVFDSALEATNWANTILRVAAAQLTSSGGNAALSMAASPLRQSGPATGDNSRRRSVRRESLIGKFFSAVTPKAKSRSHLPQWSTPSSAATASSSVIANVGTPHTPDYPSGSGASHKPKKAAEPRSSSPPHLAATASDSASPVKMIKVEMASYVGHITDTVRERAPETRPMLPSGFCRASIDDEDSDSMCDDQPIDRARSSSLPLHAMPSSSRRSRIGTDVESKIDSLTMQLGQTMPKERHHHKEKSEKHQHKEKSEKHQHKEKSDKHQHKEKSDKSHKDKSEKHQQKDKSEKHQHKEKSEKHQHKDKSEKQHQHKEKSEKHQQKDKSEKHQHKEKSEKHQHKEKSEKHQHKEKSEKHQHKDKQVLSASKATSKTLKSSSKYGDDLTKSNRRKSMALPAAHPPMVSTKAKVIQKTGSYDRENEINVQLASFVLPTNGTANRRHSIMPTSKKVLTMDVVKVRDARREGLPVQWQ